MRRKAKSVLGDGRPALFDSNILATNPAAFWSAENIRAMCNDMYVERCPRRWRFRRITNESTDKIKNIRARIAVNTIAA